MLQSGLKGRTRSPRLITQLRLRQVLRFSNPTSAPSWLVESRDDRAIRSGHYGAGSKKPWSSYHSDGEQAYLPSFPVPPFDCLSSSNVQHSPCDPRLPSRLLPESIERASNVSRGSVNTVDRVIAPVYVLEGILGVAFRSRKGETSSREISSPG